MVPWLQKKARRQLLPLLSFVLHVLASHFIWLLFALCISPHTANSGISCTQTFSWDKTFRRPEFGLTLPPLGAIINSPGNNEARLSILYFESCDVFIFRAARENNPRIFHESCSAMGLLPRVLYLLQVSFFYRIAGINTVFSEIPAAGKMDVYNYIVAFLTQQSELTGNPYHFS